MASKVKAAVKDKKDEAVAEKEGPETPDAPLPRQRGRYKQASHAQCRALQGSRFGLQATTSS